MSEYVCVCAVSLAEMGSNRPRFENEPLVDIDDDHRPRNTNEHKRDEKETFRTYVTMRKYEGGRMEKSYLVGQQ